MNSSKGGTSVRPSGSQPIVPISQFNSYSSFPTAMPSGPSTMPVGPNRIPSFPSTMPVGFQAPSSYRPRFGGIGSLADAARGMYRRLPISRYQSPMPTAPPAMPAFSPAPVSVGEISAPTPNQRTGSMFAPGKGGEIISPDNRIDPDYSNEPTEGLSPKIPPSLVPMPQEVDNYISQPKVDMRDQEKTFKTIYDDYDEVYDRMVRSPDVYGLPPAPSGQRWINQGGIPRLARTSSILGNTKQGMLNRSKTWGMGRADYDSQTGTYFLPEKGTYYVNPLMPTRAQWDKGMRYDLTPLKRGVTSPAYTEPTEGLSRKVPSSLRRFKSGGLVKGYFQGGLTDMRGIPSGGLGDTVVMEEQVSPGYSEELLEVGGLSESPTLQEVGSKLSPEQMDLVVREIKMAIAGQHPQAEMVIEAAREMFGDQFLEEIALSMAEERLSAESDGMSDSIPAMLGEEQVALSEGEYVVPADTVSDLGNGSTDAGGRALDRMVQEVRIGTRGTPVQGDAIIPDDFFAGKLR